MKVAVIGVGGVGSAATRFLAQAGHDVVGFEQFRIGHDRGSSHGESRIIRYTYPDALYTRLMADAYPLWDDLEAAAGEELFVRCGGLFFGARGSPLVAEAEAALAASALPYEKLEPDALRARFPGLRLRPGEVALFQPESGFLRPARCVHANVRLARAAGATIHEETPVRRIVARGGEVLVETERGDVCRFDRVIVTAGPWMGHLLSSRALPLVVTRQQIVYLKPTAPELFAPGRFPVWIDADANVYGFPDDGRIPGVKLAAHTLGERADPDAVRRPVDDAYIQEMVAYARERLPSLSEEETHTQVCLYTNTPDEDFLIGRAPGLPHVWLVSGCSGHGFKSSVLLGKIAADLAVTDTCPYDLRRFSLRRFATA